MQTIKRDIVGAFIISADGKLLLGKNDKDGVYQGTWVVPGGGVNENETELEALRRKTQLEVGIDIDGQDVEPIKGTITGESEKNLPDTGERALVKMTFHNYAIKLSDEANDVRVKPDSGFMEPKWFSKGELKELVLSPPTATTLKKLGYLA